MLITRQLLTALATGLLLLCPLTTFADQSYIEVTGMGQVKASPDIAHVKFSFSQTSLEQVQAKRLVDTQVINLLKLTEKLGVKKADVHAARLSIYPEYDYKQNRRLTGYRVSRDVSITLREISNYSTLIDGAVKIGATQSGQLTHDFSNRQELENKAMLAALKQAKHKASLLAEEAGAKVGQVLSIHESGNYSPPQPLVRMQMSASGEAPYPTGDLTIIKNLTVKYALDQ
jgi:hypothetical protein